MADSNRMVYEVTQNMKIQMKLLSDTIFGNGRSLPGEEDISVLADENGFPYYKGGTFKGIFREELSQYLALTGGDESTLTSLLGFPGDDESESSEKLVFSDFVISDPVKTAVLDEIGTGNPDAVLNAFTSMRVFTKIGDDGTAAAGSLRMARCVNKDIVLNSEILCRPEDEEIVEDVLGLIKSVGSMRNRGFGMVRISGVNGGN